MTSSLAAPRVALVSIVLSFAALPSWAGVSCHCFRDRAFDVRQPAASDPYLLATTQNSLLAAAYGVEKKQVVRDKMGGAAGPDLWIAHRAAAERDLTAQDLIGKRTGANSWAEVLRNHGVNPDSWLQGASLQEPTDATLAAAVVDQVLIQHLGADRAALGALRQEGADDSEVIVASYLAHRGGADGLQLYRRVAAGSATWSGLLHKFGGVPEGVEDDLRERLH